jgi:hypothetical protein
MTGQIVDQIEKLDPNARRPGFQGPRLSMPHEMRQKGPRTCAT